MPKAAGSGRERRRRTKEVAANLHVESTKAQRPGYTDQYKRWRRRRFGAFSLIALGSIVVLSHVVVHLGNIEWLPMQDLLTGYPMGGVLIVIGLLVLGAK